MRKCDTVVCFVLSTGSHAYLSVIPVAEKFNILLPLEHLKFIGLGEQVKSLLYNVKKITIITVLLQLHMIQPKWGKGKMTGSTHFS